MTTTGHLRIDSVSQRYGNVTALRDVDLDVAAGEFVTLLGPSGCGKTTLLRIISGFARPSSGAVVLDGADLTRVPPHKRPVNMVFQQAALFPHLDVAGNVAFGLKLARLPKTEIAQRVRETLALVRLGGYERRRAHELSGGQMQRVALARALVNRPRVLLLDEPLSALDLRIRLELEVELRRIHRETGATFVFVTHDQREALALSDRVVVFDQGRVEQVGTPDAVYRNPSSAYVARFVGEANVIPVDVSANGTGTIARVGEHRLVLDGRQATEGDAWLVVRSEAISLGPMDDAQLRGTVRDVAFRGSGYAYRIDVPGLPEPLKVETAGAGEPHDVGRAVGIRWDAASACVIPRGPGEGPEPAPEAVG